MFQLIATTVTIGCLLWMTALQPAHAALKQGPIGTATTAIAQPNYGAVLSAAAKLPESFDFSETAER